MTGIGLPSIVMLSCLRSNTMPKSLMAAIDMRSGISDLMQSISNIFSLPPTLIGI